MRALREEAVARVNRVCAGNFRGADDRGHVQVALRALRRTDADVFIGEPHVQRVLVGFGVDRDRLDAELPARHDHAQRDLPAVGNEDLLEHVSGPGSRRAARRMYGLPVLDVALDDFAFRIGGDLVHQLHRLDDAEHLILADRVTDFDEGGASGSGER